MKEGRKRQERRYEARRLGSGSGGRGGDRRLIPTMVMEREQDQPGLVDADGSGVYGCCSLISGYDGDGCRCTRMEAMV